MKLTSQGIAAGLEVQAGRLAIVYKGKHGGPNSPKATTGGGSELRLFVFVHIQHKGQQPEAALGPFSVRTEEILPIPGI